MALTDSELLVEAVMLDEIIVTKAEALWFLKDNTHQLPCITPVDKRGPRGSRRYALSAIAKETREDPQEMINELMKYYDQCGVRHRFLSQVIEQRKP